MILKYGESKWVTLTSRGTLKRKKTNKHKNPTSFDNVKVTYFQVMDICTDNFTLLQTVQSNTHGN